MPLDLAEATRQYQATLTAFHSAREGQFFEIDDEDPMRDELEAAERVMNTAWLEHTIGRTIDA